MTKPHQILIPGIGVLYYLNGKLHREDGPAVICSNETLFWYLNGIEINPEDLPCVYDYLKLKYLS